jgi:branched-chain amino acid transport system permease protein
MIIGSVLEAFLYGISLGMLYVLVALGLTLIFGLMEVVNFAHGAFVTLGAYLGITVLGTIGNFWVALLAAGLLVGLGGVALERSLIKPLYGVNPVYQLLLTFGVALVIEGLIIIGYGEGNQRIDTPGVFAGDAIPVGPAVIPQYRIFIIVFTGILIGIIWLTIQRTRLGLIIKAGIEDRERTELLGIRLGRVNMLIMGMGSALAGIAGLLVGPIQGIDPHLGTGLLIISFVIIVIGGLGNIVGTIIAGLIVGVIYTFSLFFYPRVAEPVIFLAMIVVLLVRPHGLFGEAEV